MKKLLMWEKFSLFVESTEEAILWLIEAVGKPVQVREVEEA